MKTSRAIPDTMNRYMKNLQEKHDIRVHRERGRRREGGGGREVEGGGREVEGGGREEGGGRGEGGGREGGVRGIFSHNYSKLTSLHQILLPPPQC